MRQNCLLSKDDSYVLDLLTFRDFARDSEFGYYQRATGHFCLNGHRGEEETTGNSGKGKSRAGVATVSKVSPGGRHQRPYCDG